VYIAFHRVEGPYLIHVVSLTALRIGKVMFLTLKFYIQHNIFVDVEEYVWT